MTYCVIVTGSMYSIITICNVIVLSGKSHEDGIQYIRRKFQAASEEKKQTYIHVSCAIDVDLMKKLIADVMDIIVESNLKKSKQML